MKIEFEYTKKDWRAEIFDIEVTISVDELGKFEVVTSDENETKVGAYLNSMDEAKKASIVLVKELLSLKIARLKDAIEEYQEFIDLDFIKENIDTIATENPV